MISFFMRNILSGLVAKTSLYSSINTPFPLLLNPPISFSFSFAFYMCGFENPNQGFVEEDEDVKEPEKTGAFSVLPQLS